MSDNQHTITSPPPAESEPTAPIPTQPAPTAPSSTTSSPFLPGLLIASAVILLAGNTYFGLSSQTTALYDQQTEIQQVQERFQKTFEENEQAFAQVRQADQKATALLQDLLELAKSDNQAALIVQKHRVRASNDTVSASQSNESSAAK